ncbi:cobyrinate a,c-diamide synthase, partial [Asanoa iriomotensis]
MSAVPRVVVSAPSSGHGKTALAVGLLAAFAGRGLTAVGFKVGPDHTDAAYLGAAAGSPGRNLDPRLVGAHRIAPLFAHGAEGHDIAVVEGTMGLFDSLAGRVETDSTAGVAAALRAPVIMVVDVGAMGQSVAALVHGFRAYDELTWLGGVILNRVASDRHEQLLREALDDIGVPVYGALRRRDLPSTLPPRHEGVVPVLHREVEALRGIRRLGESIAGAVDLDGLLALARSAPNLPTTPWSPATELAATPDDTAAVLVGRRPVVALAGGLELSFAYAETRELLEAAGATVVAVDPLRDELLPEGTDALVIGGALPEAYAEELSANRRLCADVADLARSGRPVIAEGAGLLWLTQAFDGRPMCGVLDATGTTGDQMIVGYRDATARATTAVAEIGARVVGYKQHRGVVSPRAGQTPAWTWNGGTPEGFVWRRVHASQLSLHWAGFPEIARRLVLAARPGAGPAPGGSWGQPTGAVPVIGPRAEIDYGTAPTEAATDGRGFPAVDGAPRLRAVPGGATPEPAGEGAPPADPPRLRVVPPLPDDDDPTDGRGFAPPEHVTDGFGFAGVPGARGGAADGYAYVMADEGPDGARRQAGGEPGREFGFPLGRGGIPAAGSGFGPAMPASAVPTTGGSRPVAHPPPISDGYGPFGPDAAATSDHDPAWAGGASAHRPPDDFGPFGPGGSPSAQPTVALGGPAPAAQPHPVFDGFGPFGAGARPGSTAQPSPLPMSHDQRR